MIPRWKQFFTAQNGEKLTVLKKILKLDEKVETFADGIANANTKADNAVTTAGHAVETANGAVLTANASITLAETANTSASQAVNNANSALEKAQEALDYTITGAAAIKQLVAIFTTSGANAFSPADYPSIGNIYDVVLIGGGGGGCIDSDGDLTSGVGGGSGAVKKVENCIIDSGYIMYVGSAGESRTGSGSNGGMTYFFKRGKPYEHYANGGYGANSASDVSFSGGIGGSDSFLSNTGRHYYGAGGDNAYGRGARGGPTADDLRNALGYGAGGWGTLQPATGAIMVYALMAYNDTRVGQEVTPI